MSNFSAGQEVDQYTLTQQIGEGGMGVVFSAQQPRMNRNVAIKFLSEDEYAETVAGGKQRFEREVQMIAQLEHPNVLPVYAFGYHEEVPYIVMRYMTGGTFSDRLKEGQMQVEDALHLLGQVAEALDYAHERGIVHRDLKPANIFMDNRKNAYLADFGLAKTMSGSHDLTRTDEGISGTPDYMSPEQVRGVRLDGRSDVYSLGIITYQALSGTPPFQGSNPMETVLKHLSAKVPSLHEAVPTIPAEVDAVFERILAKDPSERYPLASGFIDDLRQAIGLNQEDSQPETLQTAPDSSNQVHTVLGYSEEPITLEGVINQQTQVLDKTDQPGLPASPPTLQRLNPITSPETDSQTQVQETPAPPKSQRRNLIIGGGVAFVIAAVLLYFFLNQDPFTNLPTTDFAIGQGPRAVANTDSNDLWVINNEANSLARVDATCDLTADSCLIQTESVNTRPVALAANESYVWVGHQLNNQMVRFDQTSGAVESFDLPLQPTYWVWAEGSLWASMGSAVYQLSAEGTIQDILIDRTPAEGEEPPAARYIPAQIVVTDRFVWIGDEGSGVLQQIARDSGDIQEIPLPNSASGLLLMDYHNGQLWVSASQSGRLFVLDADTGQILHEIADIARPQELKIAHGFAWVADIGENQIAIYDIESIEPVGQISIDGRPATFDITQCGTNCFDLWVATISTTAGGQDQMTRYRLEDILNN